MEINGKEYAWADTSVVISGKTTPVIGIREINYGTQQQHEHLHAAGRDPYSVTSGNKTYQGNLILLQSEVEALQKAMPAGKDITDARDIQITVAYLPDGEGQIVTDQIKGVRFEEVQKGMASGDGHMEVNIPFKALKINYNV